MIDFTNCKIEQISVHQIGNKTNEETIRLSKAPLEVSDDKLQELLTNYFLKPFADPEFYNFTFSNGEFELNPLFNYVSSIYENTEEFHENSRKIAGHLYEVSVHPNIKAGDLFVVRFSRLQINEEVTEAIGIFKSENRQAFLKVENNSSDFSLQYDDGINISKLDKGCLVFNLEKTDGYKVCVVDKSNKLTEAQYWKDIFLNLRPRNDNFHSTREFLNITKQYVTKQVSEEFEIEKTDKIDILNRSVEYFKSHETFDKKEFETDVFNNEELVESFNNFDKNYRETNEISINENFEISSQAVKKQARAFKSVLKLDKNFHIYIHGDKNKIEKGTDSDGRKYYKIYYEKEI